MATFGPQAKAQQQSERPADKLRHTVVMMQDISCNCKMSQTCSDVHLKLGLQHRTTLWPEWKLAWNSGTRGLELNMETSTTQLLHIFFCYAQTSQKKVAHKRHRHLILNTCSPMTVNQGKHQKGTEQNQVHIPPPPKGIPVTVTITLSHKFTLTLSHKLSVIYISKLLF